MRYVRKLRYDEGKGSPFVIIFHYKITIDSLWSKHFTQIQHFYLTKYHTDDWYLAKVFSSVCFSVVEYLRGLYNHALISWLETGQHTPWRSYPFVSPLHYLIIIIIILLFLSEGMNIWNAFQVSYVGCLSKMKPIFSVIVHAIYGSVCFQLTHFSCDDYENMYICYRHHEVGSINHESLLRVRLWNNSMCCMSLYVLILLFQYYNLETDFRLSSA